MSEEGAERRITTAPRAGGHAKDRGGEAGKLGEFERDETLQDPRCVFQVLRRHFARYTPAFVERGCGVPQDEFLRVADAFTSASGPTKTGAICYAVGWTQHSTGVQIIRAAAILQLLLGNIGRPGGGILALRGHASIQGSTDIPTLYDMLPGYLPMPFFAKDGKSFDEYVKMHTTDKGLWSSLDTYIVSLLKAYYGDGASRTNDCGLRLAAARQRGPFALRLLARNAGRHARGPVRHGPEPRRGCAERPVAAHRAREVEMAGRPRSGRNRDRELLA